MVDVFDVFDEVVQSDLTRERGEKKPRVSDEGEEEGEREEGVQRGYVCVVAVHLPLVRWA